MHRLESAHHTLSFLSLSPMKQTEPTQDPKILIESAKRGDKGAFEQMYRLYFTPVYRYIFLRVKDKSEVELLAQDVFIKVYKSLSTYEVKTASPLSYFFTIARNTIIDYWRKNRHQVSFGKEDILLQIPDKEAQPHEASEKRVMAEHLYRAINKLSHEQREAIIEKYFNSVPNSEIAKVMGKSEEAVRQLQSRGLKSLRELLVHVISN